MNRYHDSSRPRTLIVDDDAVLRTDLSAFLVDQGYDTITAGDGKTAITILDGQPIDLLLLDLQLPRISGMNVLRQAAEQHPELPVVVISGKGTIRTAVEATKLGIYDFLEKPVDRNRLLLSLHNAIEKAALLRQRDLLLEEARRRYRMIGSGPAMQDIYRLIDRAALTQSKVLIIGESGTGKEMIARALHHSHPAGVRPFVAVNCAAVPEELIESELFGHEQGAFTGARKAHRGKFERARGGSLFLDEVGDMSLSMQAKLLRVLEQGHIERVGSERPISIDVRVIAATHKNLQREIEAGRFRDDLYYRLNVITIHVPPLRNRREDIPHLLTHFLQHVTDENGLPTKRLTPDAKALLVAHDWPGNVRELRNIIERLVVLSESELILRPTVLQALRKEDRGSRVLELRDARARFERDFILQALIASEWHIEETAAVLGIDRRHLWRKMKGYGIERGL